MDNKKNIIYYILIIFLILLCFPKSYIDDYLIIRNIVFYTRIIFCCILIVIYLYRIKKKGFSKFFICQSIFILLTLFSTLINHQNLIYYIKVYFFNFSVLVFGELMFRDKNRNNIIKFLAKYLKFLLIINFGTVILKNLIGFNLYNSTTTYFIGMDNRFILYIIPCLLCYAYLEYLSNKRYIRDLVFVYLIGVISLYITWSVASLLIMLLIGALYILLKSKKLLIQKMNMKYLLILIILANYLIVVLKIQNVFSDFVINTLHKSITLSYRTILWDSGINLIKSNIIHTFFGLGYFNPSNLIPIYIDGTGVNHLHNLLVDVTFNAGVIGCITYVYSLLLISKNINKIISSHLKVITILLFLGLLLYLIFDSFELYPIYYFSLFLFYYSGYIEENKEVKTYEKSINYNS